MRSAVGGAVWRSAAVLLAVALSAMPALAQKQAWTARGTAQ
jgi:hypothetical protein